MNPKSRLWMMAKLGLDIGVLTLNMKSEQTGENVRKIDPESALSGAYRFHGIRFVADSLRRSLAWIAQQLWQTAGDEKWLIITK